MRLAIYRHTKTSAMYKSIQEAARAGIAVKNNELFSVDAAFQPGGTPRGTAVMDSTDVVTAPELSVTISVTSVGPGEIVGSADVLNTLSVRMGRYVLVARPENTVPPIGALTDVLKVYGGVVNVGVGRRKLGIVVATVAEIDEKREATDSAVSGLSVAFRRG